MRASPRGRHPGQGAAALLIAALLTSGAPARADEPLRDAQSAVLLGRNAFEYRDFERVVEVLDPWLHPPKILDRALMGEARRLMGVSLHLLGRVEAAREEFGQLLVLDPKHQLDPFVVPPQVIETYEAVREELRPTLEQILASRGDAPLDAPSAGAVTVVELPHGSLVLAPAGIPQFALDQPAWGLLYGAVQIAGLVLNVHGFLAAREFKPQEAGYDRAVRLQYAGLGVLGLGWGASALHGWLTLQDRREALRPRSPASSALPFDAPRLPARATVGFALPF